MYPDSFQQEKKHNVWITGQQDIFGTSTPFSETWPKQGIMLDGVCWEQMIVEADIEGKDCGYLLPTPRVVEIIEHPKSQAKRLGDRTGNKPNNLQSMAKFNLWPTPTMNENIENIKNRDKYNHRLEEHVAMMPTPNTMDHLPCRSQEAKDRQFATTRKGRSAPGNLREWIHPEMWPTPTASDHRDIGGPSSPAIQRREEIGKSIELSMKVDGALNPDWVEWLMSWPVGWTSLEDLESDEILNPSIEPDIPRVTKKTENRAKRLQAIGNGQFSLCVVKAWKLLNKV